MSDRGRFSGMKWHTEYHTMERKKKKTADCKYLNEKRICFNTKSPCFMSMCFEATMCTYRVREDEIEIEIAPKVKTKAKQQRKECSIPMGTEIKHANYGTGKLIDYDKEKAIMKIKFGLQEVKFKYPDAINKGYLKVLKE